MDYDFDISDYPPVVQEFYALLQRGCRGHSLSFRDERYREGELDLCAGTHVAIYDGTHNPWSDDRTKGLIKYAWVPRRFYLRGIIDAAKKLIGEIEGL